VKSRTVALALAAALAVGGVGHAADAPSFKLIRSDESYAYLADEPGAGLDGLRYIPLGPDAYLSLGGEARLRVDSLDAPRFGVGGAQADVYGLGRALFSADLHLGSRVRVYGQLGLHRDIDKKEPPAVSDRDGLDAQVAFVDVTPDADRRWRLRLGRQEIAFNADPALRLGARKPQHPPELRRRAGGPPDRGSAPGGLLRASGGDPDRRVRRQQQPRAAILRRLCLQRR
jgi:hypothetical protein